MRFRDSLGKLERVSRVQVIDDFANAHDVASMGVAAMGDAEVEFGM
jgi:hypothetical protein